MLRLYAGRENIDKERFIYENIRGEALVIVPNQYTLVAEEQALKYTGTDCLFDIEIISMNRLGLRLLTEQGTESVNMLDKYGRFMLLSRLIREHAGDFEIFRRSAGKQAFTAMLNDFISEFKQQECTLDELSDMLGGDEADPILRAKLEELRGVIEAYEQAVSGKYTDSEDYISMYIDAIGKSGLIRGREIWIYGYDSITPKFARAMLELASAADSVNFILNRSDFGLDEEIEGMLRAKCREAGIPFSCEEIGKEYRLAKSKTVSRIESSLWADDPGAMPQEESGLRASDVSHEEEGLRASDVSHEEEGQQADGMSQEESAGNESFAAEDLTLVCASNPYYEAESAAAYIWHLIRDLGYRMRDIQVIANDEGAMHPVIRRVFAEYGLPVFMDAARDITDTAPVSFIVDLLRFIVHGMNSQYLFAMLKTGLAGVPAETAEDLENYARTYHIRGSMWDKDFKYGEENLGPELFSTLNEVRRDVSIRIKALRDIAGGKLPVAEFVKAFRSYLDEVWELTAAVEDLVLEEEALGFHDEAQRTGESYDKALELLDQMTEVMGDAELDIAEFTEIYTAGLTSVEVGVIPPAADGLSVGTMIRTRPRPIRAVLVLGANEGILPMQPSPEGLFSIDEKEYFRSKGFALGSLDDIKMDEENAAMYRMLTKPSDKIYISWSLTDTEGGELSPSLVIDLLKTLFPDLNEDGRIARDVVSAGWGDSTLSGAAPGDVINTPDESIRHMMDRIKDRNAGGTEDPLMRSLISWYSANRRGELDAMLAAAGDENLRRPLGRSMAAKLFGRSDGSLVLSASSIGGYFDCPFKYFIDRGLRPREEREFSSDPRSIGDAYHKCLMGVARKLLGDRELLERIAQAGEEEDADSIFLLIEKMVDEELSRISREYEGGLFISAGSEQFRMDRIREICTGAASAMARQLSSESLIDAVFEEDFGRRGRFDPVALEVDGIKVYVEGTIDRSDILDVGGSERVRIIDYKTGSDKLDLWKMRNGYRMQLMIYLISAADGGLEPAGMFYFNIKDPIVGIDGESAKKAAEIMSRAPGDTYKLKGRYIDDPGVLEAMPSGVLAGGRTSKDRSMTREQYEELRKDVISRIEETAAGIIRGAIDISPLRESGRLACDRCSYKPICRRDREYTKNRAREIRPEAKESSKD